MRDYDGEFLLIEAAMVLPPWIEPDTSHNRLFIADGRLHIVRPPQSPKEVGLYPSGKLSLEDALKHVRNPDLDTFASAEIEAVIAVRVAGYPGKIGENTHRSRCFLPRKVAEILAREPRLVAPAVEAFYSWDPMSMRIASKMERFDPSTCVPVTVRFTRLTFAQLASQQFYPPKPFLPHVPPSSDRNFLAWQAGGKLACGFEMLAAEPRWRKLAEQFPDWMLEDHNFDADVKWDDFRRALESRGYFETTETDVRLLEKLAREQYLLHNLPPSKPRADPVEVVYNPAALIAHLISQPALDDSLLNHEPEDSEAWMTVEEDELEQILGAHGASLTAEDLDATDGDDILQKDENGDGESDDEVDSDEDEADDSKELDKLRRLVSGMSEFLDRESGLGGAVFPGEQEDEDEDAEDLERKFEELMDSDDGEADDSIADVVAVDAKRRRRDEPSLDPGKFASAMNRAMRKADSDDESDSENGGEGPGIEAYMEAMDAELGQTKLADDFERMETTETGSDELPPVNLDLNLVKNLLASFHAQDGLPGPATGLLAGLGVGKFKLPKEE